MRFNRADSWLLARAFAVFVLFSVSPALAYLNVTSNSLSLPSQTNLSSNATMLNLTFNLTDDTQVNVTNIDFRFISTNASLNANQTNLSICVYNSSVSAANLLGCNSTWDSNITSVPVGYNISNETSADLIVVYEIFPNCAYPMNISMNISSNTSIGLDNGGIYINTTFPISSGFTDVRVVRATASIWPRYVDTNVTNQTLRYFIYQTTGDYFNKTTITVPTGFSLVGIANYSYVKSDMSTVTNTSGGCSGDCSIVDNQLSIFNSVGIRNLTIYFNVNTNASAWNSTAFNSTIDGTNVENITTDVTTGATNVTTKQLINVTKVSAMKNAAIVNGTDYWEFNFTLNISATVLGLVQFNMGNWYSTSANTTMNLTNGTGSNITYRASMRNQSNYTAAYKCNISNSYNITDGVSLNATENNAYTLFLRMVVPSGTPIASDWWTTYSMLFRVQP